MHSDKACSLINFYAGEVHGWKGKSPLSPSGESGLQVACRDDVMAGVQGFEPQLTDPESAVLPLNDTPLCLLAVLFYS